MRKFFWPAQAKPGSGSGFARLGKVKRPNYIASKRGVKTALRDLSLRPLRPFSAITAIKRFAPDPIRENPWSALNSVKLCALLWLWFWRPDPQCPPWPGFASDLHLHPPLHKSEAPFSPQIPGPTSPNFPPRNFPDSYLSWFAEN